MLMHLDMISIDAIDLAVLALIRWEILPPKRTLKYDKIRHNSSNNMTS